jgi:hypothetical protein
MHLAQSRKEVRVWSRQLFNRDVNLDHVHCCPLSPTSITLRILLGTHVHTVGSHLWMGSTCGVCGQAANVGSFELIGLFPRTQINQLQKSGVEATSLSAMVATGAIGAPHSRS